MIEIPDTQEETIHEMADRLHELAATRFEDGPLTMDVQRSGSPTEVVNESAAEEMDREMPVSPLMALKRLVEENQTKKGKKATAESEVLEGKMELTAIESEANKLTNKEPQNLLLPCERGFAGVVLGNKPQVLNVKYFDANEWNASMMEGAAEENEEPPDRLVRASEMVGRREHHGQLRKRMIAGWMVVISEANKCVAEQLQCWTWTVRT